MCISHKIFHLCKEGLLLFTFLMGIYIHACSSNVRLTAFFWLIFFWDLVKWNGKHFLLKHLTDFVTFWMSAYRPWLFSLLGLSFGITRHLLTSLIILNIQYMWFSYIKLLFSYDASLILLPPWMSRFLKQLKTISIQFIFDIKKMSWSTQKIKKTLIRLKTWGFICILFKVWTQRSSVTNPLNCDKKNSSWPWYVVSIHFPLFWLWKTEVPFQFYHVPFTPCFMWPFALISPSPP